MELNDRQKRFCEEYLIDFNGTQAAIRAGYSVKTANEQSSQLLTKLNIQNYIKTLSEPAEKQLGITRERTMQEIGRIAFSDLRKFFDETGVLKQIIDIDDDSAAALASVEVDEIKVDGMAVGSTKKIKTYDKTKALEMLAKHFKIYSDAPVNVFDLANATVIFK